MFSVPSDADCFGIRSEKFFQCLRILSGNQTDGIGGLELLFASPEVLPEMCQMIDRVRVDPLLHCIGPLLVRDCDISKRPTNCPGQTLDHLPYCRSFTD